MYIRLFYSFEVGEHIPPDFEYVYLENLVRHARIGIVLSWSQPNHYPTRGLAHVNRYLT